MKVSTTNSMGYTQEDMDRLWPDNPNMSRTAKKNYCPNGHKRTEANTGMDEKGFNRCRICFNTRQQKNNERRRAKTKVQGNSKTRAFQNRFPDKEVIVRYPKGLFYNAISKKRTKVKDINFAVSVVVDSSSGMDVTDKYIKLVRKTKLV